MSLSRNKSLLANWPFSTIFLIYYVVKHNNTFSGLRSVWMTLQILWRKSNPIKTCLLIYLAKLIGTPSYSYLFNTSSKLTPKISKTIQKWFPYGPLNKKEFNNWTTWVSSLLKDVCPFLYYFKDLIHSGSSIFLATFCNISTSS